MAERIALARHVEHHPFAHARRQCAQQQRRYNQNRTKIASLQNAAGQLRKSNIKVGALEKIIVPDR